MRSLLRLGQCVLICLLYLGVTTAEEPAPHAAETVTVKPRGEIVPNKLNLDQAAKLIIDQTNLFRESEKRSPVKMAPKLMETARDFASYMARTNRYGHEADGTQPEDRAKKHEYDVCIVAENIAYEYSSIGFKQDELAKLFTEGWKNSPGHRRNMLDPDVTETGVAIAWSPETGHYFAVQMFGRPHSQAIKFQIANRADKPAEYQIGDRKFMLPIRAIRTHEVCRPVEVKFLWSDDLKDSEVVQPKHGSEITVVEKAGRLQVELEQAAETK